MIACTHAGGAVSQAAISVTTPGRPTGLVVEVLGAHGRLQLDTDAAGRDDIRAAMATIAAEFATAVRTGVAHPLDVHRGLFLQRLITTIERDLLAAAARHPPAGPSRGVTNR